MPSAFLLLSRLSSTTFWLCTSSQITYSVCYCRYFCRQSYRTFCFLCSQSNMSHPQSVLIVGHSFVHRLEEYISQSDLHNFSLSASKYTIFFKSFPGGHIRDLSRVYQFILDNSIQVVLIDLGTNDIDSQINPSHLLAIQLYTMANHMVRDLGVKQVAIMEVFFRTQTGKFAPKLPEFNTRIHQFNNKTKIMCKSVHKSSRQIHFLHHSGLVDNWAQYIVDGVHLTKQGLLKYYKSFRSSIIQHSCQALRF